MQQKLRKIPGVVQDKTTRGTHSSLSGQIPSIPFCTSAGEGRITLHQLERLVAYSVGALLPPDLEPFRDLLEEGEFILVDDHVPIPRSPERDAARRREAAAKARRALAVKRPRTRRRSPNAGKRFGEALHPGPGDEATNYAELLSAILRSDLHDDLPHYDRAATSRLRDEVSAAFERPPSPAPYSFSNHGPVIWAAADRLCGVGVPAHLVALVSRHRPKSVGSGIRYGEADNPGPLARADCSARFCDATGVCPPGHSHLRPKPPAPAPAPSPPGESRAGVKPGAASTPKAIANNAAALFRMRRKHFIDCPDTTLACLSLRPALRHAHLRSTCVGCKECSWADMVDDDDEVDVDDLASLPVSEALAALEVDARSGAADARREMALENADSPPDLIDDDGNVVIDLPPPIVVVAVPVIVDAVPAAPAAALVVVDAPPAVPAVNPVDQPSLPVASISAAALDVLAINPTVETRGQVLDGDDDDIPMPCLVPDAEIATRVAPGVLFAPAYPDSGCRSLFAILRAPYRPLGAHSRYHVCDVDILWDGPRSSDGWPRRLLLWLKHALPGEDYTADHHDHDTATIGGAITRDRNRRHRHVSLYFWRRTNVRSYARRKTALRQNVNAVCLDDGPEQVYTGEAWTFVILALMDARVDVRRFVTSEGDIDEMANFACIRYLDETYPTEYPVWRRHTSRLRNAIDAYCQDRRRDDIRHQLARGLKQKARPAFQRTILSPPPAGLKSTGRVR